MARVRARAVYLHGINTLYHAVSVYTGMHKTLENLETLALRARVSKPVSAVLCIPVYTSTAWYNLYLYSLSLSSVLYSFALLHQLAYFCVVIVAFEGTRWWLLNNIGLVLHNQACGTPCFIIVPMTTSYNNSIYSTSRSCLHSFLCNPYIPFKISIFF